VEIVDYIIVSGGNVSDLRKSVLDLLRNDEGWLLNGPWQMVITESTKRGVRDIHSITYLQNLVRVETPLDRLPKLVVEPQHIMGTRRGAV